MIKVIKNKNGIEEDFNPEKILTAIDKSAERVNYEFTADEKNKVLNFVENKLSDRIKISVNELHNFVEMALDVIKPEVAKSYKDYRNYKHEQSYKILYDLENKTKNILNVRDYSNSNSNTLLISTKRTEIAQEFAKELYQKMYLDQQEIQAMHEGFIYVHDLKDMLLPQFNCLDSSTLITIREENGYKATMTIGEFYAKNYEQKINEIVLVNGIEIESRKCFVNMNAIVKRKVNTNEKVYKFATKNSSIIVTENHKIPVIDENNTEILKYAKDILKTDKLIIRQDKEIDTVNHINLLNIAKNQNIDVTVYLPKKVQHYIAYKYNTSIASILNILPKKIPYLDQYVKLTLLQYERLIEAIDLPYEIMQNIKISAKGSKSRLPLYIKKDENLAMVIGYIFADGAIIRKEKRSDTLDAQQQLIFTNTNVDLINHFRDCFYNTFEIKSTLIKPTGKNVCYRSTLGSRLITALFNDLDGDNSYYGYKNNAGDLRVPKFIENGNKSIKQAFLAALIDTDGCIADTCVDYTTSNKEYAEQVANMFKNIGYNTTISIYEVNMKGTEYNINGITGIRNYNSYRVKLFRPQDIKQLINNSFKVNNIKYEHKDNGCINYKYEDILFIDELSNDRYVYDIQTTDGWFIANNILVHNCCLVDMKAILTGGFTAENKFYTKPKDIKTAVGQMEDVIMMISASHYGGHTVPEIDKLLAPYYKMSIEKHEKILEQVIIDTTIGVNPDKDRLKICAKQLAYKEMEQALQGCEMALNTVANARGSYPFVTFSFGDVSNEYEADVCKAILEVRMKGHGPEGKKQSMIFPKLVFLYNFDIHEQDKEYSWLFRLAVDCSSKCMYPDFLSPIGHKREDRWVSPMGCRSFLSDFRDNESNELVFTGRFNIGVISLNTPMIAQEAINKGKDFYELLDYYLQMIRKMLDKRYKYVGKAKASSNPLMFMEGGAYGGHLKANDIIAPLLASATASFGITALHETSLILTGKSIAEDQSTALAILKHINDKIDEFKAADNHLYSLYSSPAESLAGTQCMQFTKKYGIIKGVSDKSYFTNSFHCAVTEDITPFEKQDKELLNFLQSTGGHIQYVRISNPNNIEGLKTIIRRGMKMGFYQGINFNACFCEDCGATGNDWGLECPECGSINITETNRVCGYLGHARVRGDRTLNDTKMDEVHDRISM